MNRRDARPAHPVSTFALDLYWTSGRTSGARADLEHHLAECVSCRAYLAMLDEADARDADDGASAIRPRARGPRHLRVLAQVTVALAFAAGVAVLVESALRPEAAPVYVGVKGTPSAQLLVHRGSETSIWDGQSRVRAGDALALRTSCGDLATVAVAAEDLARGTWTRLSDATCPKATDPGKGPAGGDVLPFTLIVDGQSEDEHIAVVMSDARLSDDELDRAAHDSERSPHVWVVRFAIPEERP
jgi:hypothetical protein